VHKALLVQLVQNHLITKVITTAQRLMYLVQLLITSVVCGLEFLVQELLVLHHLTLFGMFGLLLEQLVQPAQPAQLEQLEPLVLQAP
jgi:hypothetical protein